MSAYKFKPKGSKKEDITTINNKDFPELVTSVKKVDEGTTAGLKFLDKVMVVVAKEEASAAAAIVKKQEREKEAASNAVIVESNGIYVPNFDRYYKLQKERLEKERKRILERHLYSSDEETNNEEENSLAPDDDVDSFEEWTDDEEEHGDAYDPSEFDRHR